MTDTGADWTTGLNSRLRILGLLAVPFVAAWVPSALYVRVRLVNPAWFGWINGGFVVVALYLLIAPLLLQRSLRGKPLGFPGGAEALLLLMGVGGAAGVSMMPVMLLWIGSGSVSWVLPSGAVCFILQILWCWRFRRLLF